MIHNKMKQGIKDGVPIAIGYFSVSFTFGMLAAKSGISIFHAVLISLLNLTSPSPDAQFLLRHLLWKWL